MTADARKTKTEAQVGSVAISESDVFQTELGMLRVARYFMLVFAVLGFAAYAWSGSSAVQIDGLYSLINFGSALIAGWLAKASLAAATETYPYGQAAFENIYVLFRSLVILALVIFALAENGIKIFEYLAHGQGEAPEYGVVVVYCGFVAAACLVLYGLYSRACKRIGNRSELLRVERQVTLIDCSLSAGIAVSLGLVALIPSGTIITSDSFNVTYIADSLVVVVIALVLLREPVSMFRKEVDRLTGRRVDHELESEFVEAVQQVLAADRGCAGLTLVDAYVVRRGKGFDAHVCVTFSGSRTVAELDAIQDLAAGLAVKYYGNVRVYVSFSSLPIHQLGQPQVRRPS